MSVLTYFKMIKKHFNQRKITELQIFCYQFLRAPGLVSRRTSKVWTQIVPDTFYQYRLHFTVLYFVFYSDHQFSAQVRGERLESGDKDLTNGFMKKRKKWFNKF